MTTQTPPPITRFPSSGNRSLPARDERDWVLSAELIEDTGISYRQLDYWTRTGLLQPMGDIPGSGWARAFTPDQIARAHTIRELLGAGVTLQTIRLVIDEVLQNGEAHIGAVTITVHDQHGDAA